jgi:hypothetical protein
MGTVEERIVQIKSTNKQQLSRYRPVLVKHDTAFADGTKQTDLAGSCKGGPYVQGFLLAVQLFVAKDAMHQLTNPE